MSDNPYRSPEGMDDEARASRRLRRKQSRDLALAGLFLGIAYGAATGAGSTVGLYLVATLIWPAAPAAASELISQLDVWLAELVAVAVFHGILGAISGAVLGTLQGLLAARPTSGDRVRLVRSGAFGWAVVAAIWCLAVDQTVLWTNQPRWLLYLALVVAPPAAGFSGSVVASRLGVCLEKPISHCPSHCPQTVADRQRVR